MHLVIVESPAKAKTINKYLGNDYTVVASFGHVRDLPSKDGSVRPEEDFAMTYEVVGKSDKHVKTIVNSAKTADSILLATDPDREGEAISWHILEILRAKKAIKAKTPVKRVVFNEITKKAVLDAIANPRDIDLNLVNAQQARRALDYLVGFNLSPVLWRKLPGSKSAGRVQSVALRLICDREDEIEHFVTQEYWDIKLDLINSKQEPLPALLTHINGTKLDKFDLASSQAAHEIVDELKTRHYHVAGIEQKQQNRHPQPPFTTSSLQQEASRKLGFSTKRTMQLAQKLYEGIELKGENVGLITYMRTDAVYLSDEAVKSARTLIQTKYGPDYLPKAPRAYKTKAKNAQEAHEAIRPTNMVAYTPDQLKTLLDSDLFKLYELIWKRTVACQMESAVLDMVSVLIETNDKYANCRASGSTIKFDGFYRLYREGVDDQADEEHQILPKVTKDEKLDLIDIKPAQHFTEPPPRYGEASLVKKLEELGIGRPSTYASIISVLQDRDYVKLEKKRFLPEERGRLVTAFLLSFFNKYVEYDFTAHLENNLDEVSEGKLEWKTLLGEFWGAFETNVKQAKELKITDILEDISNRLDHHFFPPDKDGIVQKSCPSCQNGILGLKLGKYGAFIACSSYPECSFTKQISDSTDSSAEQDGTKPEDETRMLGTDQESGETISLRKGPYGYYIQLGEAKPKIKPKRISLPPYLLPNAITLEQATGLLSLPREIGKHPETKNTISVGIGKFGPYLLHEAKYTSLAKDEDILTIGLNRAVAIMADAASGKKSTASSIILEIGKHPESGSIIATYNGRYGPYIKCGKDNYKLPKTLDPSVISLEQALEIINAAPKK